jgi:two-component system chemotaxis response regulator CheB
MGKDGVAGIGALYKKGAYTIAQNESTSVIYGMPSVAVQRGYIKNSVSIFKMAAFVVSKL